MTIDVKYFVKNISDKVHITQENLDSWKESEGENKYQLQIRSNDYYSISLTHYIWSFHITYIWNFHDFEDHIHNSRYS